MSNVFKLRAAFTHLQAGWLVLEIQYGLEQLVIPISYIYDGLYTLVQALRANLNSTGLSVVVLWEEPQETELHFQRTGDSIILSIYSFPDYSRGSVQGVERLKICGTYEEICLPFWRAFRNLQSRYSPEELHRRWQREFPIREIELLSSAIAKTRLKE